MKTIILFDNLERTKAGQSSFLRNIVYEFPYFEEAFLYKPQTVRHYTIENALARAIGMTAYQSFELSRDWPNIEASIVNQGLEFTLYHHTGLRLEEIE